MSIDLSQFHQVFFEESFEGLDIMESGLLELDPNAVDNETVNSIFRAAHSIKGGSATFGFNHVAEFTHVMETLLDEDYGFDLRILFPGYAAEFAVDHELIDLQGQKLEAAEKSALISFPEVDLATMSEIEFSRIIRLNP